jgi:hypothetical protein
MAVYKNIYQWQRGATPSGWHRMLETLGEEYPFSETSGTRMKFSRLAEPGRITVVRTPDGVEIGCSDDVQAGRALGSVLADADGEETIPFKTIGLMLDCSRNAVFSLVYLKKLLRRFCLLGYNRVMLYLEDVYELPGEEYFGYKRGRYTAAELRELDVYAAGLGIEMIGCIQTLGHMSQLLRWSAYSHLRDTDSALLVGEGKTLTLIGKMIQFFSEVFASRRLHVGMDEVHDLGSGEYLNRYGYRPRYEILRDHLCQVARLCAEHGMEPMIWSDMFFRIGSDTGDYYDEASRIPANTGKNIPDNVEMVYWDYYHHDKAFYREWINRHRGINGRNPIMCSGIWSWAAPWYNSEYTERNALPAIEACRDEGIEEIFFALWNDNGAVGDFSSCLAGIVLCSEHIYHNEKPDDAVIKKRFNAICHASYEAVCLAAGINHEFSALGLFWDDPLLGIYYHNQILKSAGFWDEREVVFRNALSGLNKYSREEDAGSIFHIMLIMKFLAEKIALRRELVLPLRRETMDGQFLRHRIFIIISLLRKIKKSYRRIWHDRCKPFGLEVIQIRIAGQEERWLEMACRIDELERGLISSIPEMDKEAETPLSYLSYRFDKIATGSAII